MGLISNVAVDTSAKISDDVVGGGNYDPLPTDIYNMEILAAFTIESAAGAIGVSFHLKELASEKVHRETIYVSTNKANGVRNTYVDKQSGKPKCYLAINLQKVSVF